MCLYENILLLVPVPGQNTAPCACTKTLRFCGCGDTSSLCLQTFPLYVCKGTISFWARRETPPLHSVPVTRFYFEACLWLLKSPVIKTACLGASPWKWKCCSVHPVLGMIKNAKISTDSCDWQRLHTWMQEHVSDILLWSHLHTCIWSELHVPIQDHETDIAFQPLAFCVLMRIVQWNTGLWDWCYLQSNSESGNFENVKVKHLLLKLTSLLWTGIGEAEPLSVVATWPVVGPWLLWGHVLAMERTLLARKHGLYANWKECCLLLGCIIHTASQGEICEASFPYTWIAYKLNLVCYWGASFTLPNKVNFAKHLAPS